MFSRHVFEDSEELSKRQIAHLASPQPLHAVQVQVLEAQQVIVVTQLVCQLEVCIPAFIGHSDVCPADEFGRLPVIAARMGRLFRCDR
ncbi:MAG: hypothetical protein F9K27_12495 [Anaerolineae bacterium]|nr:MAG: hypothetical protein F9K27_12495 [Anaerolineae bacterium]